MDGDQTPGEGSQRCAGVFLVSDESVLFGRRSAAKSWSPGVWDVIGGRVEQDESYVAAACREVNEELGVTVEPEDLHHLETVIASDFELAVFATVRWTGTVTNVAVDEHDEVAWLKPADWYRLDLADPALAELAGQAVASCHPDADRGRSPRLGI